MLAEVSIQHKRSSLAVDGAQCWAATTDAHCGVSKGAKMPTSPAEPLRCDHGKTAMEDCLRCDPLNLLLWGRLPLATTLHLRERFRAYRETPGDSSQSNPT